MEQVIVAFEHSGTGERVREILESGGTAACVLCRSADRVRRLAYRQRIGLVVCGFKLGDSTAQQLYRDLGGRCAMLVIASQSHLDMIADPEIGRLALPVTRGELNRTVSRMLREGPRGAEAPPRPGRPEEERRLIQRAKDVLMESRGLTEEQAHRLLQKQSMDLGVPLARAARAVLDRRKG